MADFKTLNGYAVKDNQARTDIANILDVQNGLKNNLSNPNLLINSDFRNVVNQRGNNSYTINGVRTYTIDRWCSANAVKINLLSDGVRITNNGSGQYVYFLQYIETPLIVGEEYTLSSKINGIIQKHTFIGGESFNTAIPFFTYDARSNDLPYDRVGLRIEQSVTVEYIKLEKGSIATPFTPRPYAEELALCKRYYQKSEELEYFGPLISMDSTTLRCQTSFTGFRTAPTVKAPSSTTFAILNAGNAGTNKDTTLTTATMSANGEFKATVASGINVGLMCIARIHKPIEFDAEIY